MQASNSASAKEEFSKDGSGKLNNALAGCFLDLSPLLGVVGVSELETVGQSEEDSVTVWSSGWLNLDFLTGFTSGIFTCVGDGNLLLPKLEIESETILET